MTLNNDPIKVNQKTKIRIGAGKKIHYYNRCNQARIGRSFNVIDDQSLPVTCKCCLGIREASDGAPEVEEKRIVISPTRRHRGKRFHQVRVGHQYYDFVEHVSKKHGYIISTYKVVNDRLKLTNKSGIMIKIEGNSIRQAILKHFED